MIDNPQFILLGDSAYGETPDKVSARSGWGSLLAVKNKQVYSFDDNLVSRPVRAWWMGWKRWPN